ncbi:sugar ABC transporter ATP-binding protein [Rhizobium sp. TH2]|uniref:sugar ABC transporter ATP-binding protein n=1 Tax=Rhizobium sp. TH2 TaxID=2775403 RepID=UPI002157402A|nr:sugar ABC transporter ATP-binding protein [Rhizobium sp. TH2]UVC10827.1 sugar ABC transporter ATP-binding protein [Rhizobium sp. TH2]
MPDPFIQISNVSKQYPGVLALDGVSLSVAPGEVLGIVGENGAGKSTLMKILGGVVEPTSGSITVDGIESNRLTVAGSMAAGIAFVHQELNLFENLTAAANIFIGREPLMGGALRLIDNKRVTELAAPLLKQLGAEFSPDTLVGSLSLAEMQLVEIAKSLSRKSRLIIMDEPTSSLTATETERLIAVIGALKAGGVSIVFISHRLMEVERCADRVVVLRDGKQVAALERSQINADTMIRQMIGRDLKTLYRTPKAPPGTPVLELDKIRTSHWPDRAVDLTVRHGEIVGLAGLVGSGRTELACTIFGLDPPKGGAIRIDGRSTRIDTPRDAIERGIYLIPEDRKRSGLVLDFSIRNNVTLANLPRYARGGLVDVRAEGGVAERQRSKLDIRARDVALGVGSLSGGNQQKVVLAKWLSMAPRLLIFDEPTRGIDIGAKNEIYQLMRDLADQGVGILMISSDMEEIIGVSDRVAVMHEGAIAGFLERADLSEPAIMSLAVGRH